jgi:hypothetical protein
MATVYYRAFELIVIDTEGGRHVAPSVTFDADNITAAASLGTLTSDANGLVAAGSFTATAGDIVEFTDGTYPGVMRLKLQTTQTLADADPEYPSCIYVLRDDRSTYTTSGTAKIYIGDTAQPTLRPQYIGDAKAGATTLFPYKTPLAQTIRVYAVSQDTEDQFSALNLEFAEFDDVAVSALGGGASTLTIATKTANYTLADGDDLILMDCTSGNLTVTLHAVATAKQKPYYIKKIDSTGNSMTIDGNASETIDGAATKSTTVQYKSFTIVPNNAGEWSIV